MKPAYRLTYKLARRVVIGVVGTTVLLVGLALTVLPGPAFVVIPLGLGILGLEFAWARRWLRKLQHTVGGTARSVINKRKHEPDPAPATVRQDDSDRH